MTKRINHTLEVEICINSAHASFKDGYTNRADLQMQQAQVHAIQSLAEQQRVANLIALEKVWRSTSIESDFSDEEVKIQLTKWDLLDEIAESLGLDKKEL